MVKMVNKVRSEAENRLKKQEEETPAEPEEPSADIALLTEIRDLLAERRAN